METRHKVLIVDDDSAVLEVYGELLSQLPSRPEIFTTTSGAKALAMLRGDSFRLLICDLKMPKMDGLQVLSIVRRRFPELRTVVMTGVQHEELRSRAYALGVDLFWLKPDTQQNMEMFLQCVESMLGRDVEGGFRGVQSKSLMDIIQMECLSQSSTVLRIRRGPLTGRIWIQGGELIDAETDGAQGEAAFRRILEWKSGTFENLPAEPNRERRITKPANALLLEAAQAMDETTISAANHSKEEAEQAGHRKAVLHLAQLSRAGADFVVSLPENGKIPAEGWGTEATEELASWARYATEACQHLSQQLQAGPLAGLVGSGIDQRVVLAPEGKQVFLVGWPADAQAEKLMEQTQQLVASWDS
jgi:CheY-like chemotaxis protein